MDSSLTLALWPWGNSIMWKENIMKFEHWVWPLMTVLSWFCAQLGHAGSAGYNNNIPIPHRKAVSEPLWFAELGCYCCTSWPAWPSCAQNQPRTVLTLWPLTRLMPVTLRYEGHILNHTVLVDFIPVYQNTVSEKVSLSVITYVKTTQLPNWQHLRTGE